MGKHNLSLSYIDLIQQDSLKRNTVVISSNMCGTCFVKNQSCDGLEQVANTCWVGIKNGSYVLLWKIPQIFE